jgi:hypothetical protein
MKIENREQILLLVAILSIGLLAADRLIFNPLLRAWDARSARITELQESIVRGEALLQRERALRKSWRVMQKDSMSEEDSVAENLILKAVDEWAQTSRISFTSIKPTWRDHDQGYRTLECRAGAFGTLEQVARFLYELETDPMAVRVEQLEVASRDENGGQLGLSLTFTGLSLPK